MADDRFLRIYLRDQLALGVAWRELAARGARSNRGNPAGDALEQVRRGITGDVQTFQGIMRALGVAPSGPKNVLAMLGERAARLKPNGRVVRYSPLSRFEELDALIIGIDGKDSLDDLARRSRPGRAPARHRLRCADRPRQSPACVARAASSTGGIGRPCDDRSGDADPPGGGVHR